MPRPKEFDQDDVLQCAMDVFWLKGYEGTSVSDLTEATGLKPGSLYNAFSSKHGLYLHALDYYQEHVGAKLFAPFESYESGLTAIRAYFSRLIDAALADPQQRGCFMQNATAERASVDDAVYQRACTGKEQATFTFRTALERAQAAEEVPASLAIEPTARYLTSIIYAVRAAGQTAENRAELEDIVRVALSVLA